MALFHMCLPHARLVLLQVLALLLVLLLLHFELGLEDVLSGALRDGRLLGLSGRHALFQRHPRSLVRLLWGWRCLLRVNRQLTAAGEETVGAQVHVGDAGHADRVIGQLVRHRLGRLRDEHVVREDSRPERWPRAPLLIPDAVFLLLEAIVKFLGRYLTTLLFSFLETSQVIPSIFFTENKFQLCTLALTPRLFRHCLE